MWINILAIAFVSSSFTNKIDACFANVWEDFHVLAVSVGVAIGDFIHCEIFHAGVLHLQFEDFLRLVPIELVECQFG